MDFLIVAIIFGLLPAAIASKKGRSFMLWWFYGAMLFIVALPMAIFMKPLDESAAGKRKCPNCAEFIQPDARICRHCKSEIEPLSQKAIKGLKKNEKKDNYVPGWLSIGVIVGVIFFVWWMATSGDLPSSHTSQSKSLSSPNSINSSSSAVKTVIKPSWETSTSTDEMSGKRQTFISSPTVFPTKQMDFPYSDVKAWLGVGCDGSSEWAYIGFNNSPNLLDTETKNGYNRIETRIKWDNSIQNVTLIQEWGASFLHFQNDRDAISKLARANSALLELRWHGQGAVYFKFSLDGSSTALKSLRAKCGG